MLTNHTHIQNGVNCTPVYYVDRVILLVHVVASIFSLSVSIIHFIFHHYHIVKKGFVVITTMYVKWSAYTVHCWESNLRILVCGGSLLHFQRPEVAAIRVLLLVVPVH